MPSNEKFREGHRDRVRKQYLSEDFSSWEDYRILELLLFYAIPQRDVKPLAHLLLDTFGSLYGVLSQDKEALMEVPGVGSHTAEVLSCLFPAEKLARRDENLLPKYKQAAEVGAKIQEYYEKSDKSGGVFLLFNNRYEILKEVPIEATSVSSPRLSPKLLAEHTFSCNAAFSVLGFFTPSPILAPTGEDMANLHQLISLMDALGAYLLECILTNGQNCAFLLKQAIGLHLLEQRKEKLTYES